jgi:phosphoadenosine phosphosulfate reductase
LKHSLGLSFELSTPGESVLKFKEVAGFSPCVDGGVSAELTCGTVLSLTDVVVMLHPLGKVRSMDGLIFIENGNVTWHVYASGTVVVRALRPEVLRWALEMVKNQLRKAHACTGCGVCVGRCPENAIQLEGNRVSVVTGCTHCGECLKICPLVEYNG